MAKKKLPKVEPVLGGFGGFATPGYLPPDPSRDFFPGQTTVGASLRPKKPPTRPSDIKIATVAPGRVRITSTADERQTVTAWLTTPFVPTGADVGGWTVAPRDGAVGIPEYVGTDPEGWTFTLRFDGWKDRTELRGIVDRLLDIGRRGDRVRPAQIAVTGTVPAIVASRRWLLIQASPGAEGVIDDDQGRLYRMDVACQIMLPETSATISAPKVAKGDRKKPTSSVKPLAKESLLDLLMRVRGTTSGWHDVADLNNVRDPDAALLPKLKKVRVP